MLLQLILAPIWQPMKDQLSLFRALATGGRIPGTNLVLMPVPGGRCRFDLIEHIMMALAGAWLVFRVICCELAIEDRQPPAMRRQRKNASNVRQTEAETTTACSIEANHIMLVQQQKEPVPETDALLETEEMFYWGCQRLRRHQPILKFTRTQLDKLLRLERNADDYDDNDNDDVDDDDDDDDDVVEEADDEADGNDADNNVDPDDNKTENLNSEQNSIVNPSAYVEDFEAHCNSTRNPAAAQEKHVELRRV
ncbi:suppressor of Mek1-like [Drosophila novamexicana]|uniref:suppressor of Mek1-like n=1 Tax=Drosophila novamexicana TaxID=47314 RepID=UPI0011E59468|nr:suppressor of Mek1-like [Drosophila novamexicana]